ncbi:hypothetical protein N0O92_23135 [Alkalihalobacillus sp. MEB130]|uniref:hypothetical protein n=1 Tax=Alkalihalobacillus sp. MEB130 TaxID=2976704 RepID=UPI0028DF4F4D|nr:hypothetical protein [Alkalihalobacillus sp. MEB130]MDT8863050.1 hypothetical protein [Alkalihalobacillus sp. MEB130]
MKYWETTYQMQTIRVENRWNGEKLYVNGVLQDERIGMRSDSRLYGRIINHNNEVEYIKVSIGTYLFTLQCVIFVNDQIVYSSKK